MSRDNELKQIHIKLEATLHQSLKLEAAICNLTIQELVVSLIKKRISLSKFSDLMKDGELDNGK